MSLTGKYVGATVVARKRYDFGFDDDAIVTLNYVLRNLEGYVTML